MAILEYNSNPQKYIPYDNRKAYFDNWKWVGKVIKQLTFCSSITSSILGGARHVMILMIQGGVQNLWKPDDVILERSLIVWHKFHRKNSTVSPLSAIKKLKRKYWHLTFSIDNIYKYVDEECINKTELQKHNILTPDNKGPFYHVLPYFYMCQHLNKCKIQKQTDT